jgi:hypothetical protein
MPGNDELWAGLDEVQLRGENIAILLADCESKLFGITQCDLSHETRIRTEHELAALLAVIGIVHAASMETLHQTHNGLRESWPDFVPPTDAKNGKASELVH